MHRWDEYDGTGISLAVCNRIVEAPWRARLRSVHPIGLGQAQRQDGQLLDVEQSPVLPLPPVGLASQPRRLLTRRSVCRAKLGREPPTRHPVRRLAPLRSVATLKLTLDVLYREMHRAVRGFSNLAADQVLPKWANLDAKVSLDLAGPLAASEDEVCFGVSVVDQTTAKRVELSLDPR
jgi:hypothetical protein